MSVVTRRRKGQERKITIDGIDIYRVSLKYLAVLYGLQLRNFVKSLLPSLHPDIIHIHGMGPLEWYDIDSIPLAYTNHTSGYLRRIQKGGMRRMAMLKKHFAKIDLFLAPSRELLHIPFEIKATKHFIANGVDADKFNHNSLKRIEIREKLGIGTDETVAIITRRLVDKNGVIYLARATELINDKEVKYIIIGDGPERETVEKEFHRHCGKRAIFLGNKMHNEIVDYYSAADFSILPSLMEATSISGLEAMAASLPLVGTEVGGIPELIHNGVNGFLCQPADHSDLAVKINKLLEQNLGDFGKNSRQMVEENFDWERIASATLQAYETILPARSQ